MQVPRKVIKHTRFIADHGKHYREGKIYETIVYTDGIIKHDERNACIFTDDIELFSIYPFPPPHITETDPIPMIGIYDGVSRITYDDGTVQVYLIHNGISKIHSEYTNGKL